MTLNPIPFILGSVSLFWGYVTNGSHGAGYAAAAVATIVLIGTCLKERQVVGQAAAADEDLLEIPPTIYPEAWRH